MFDEDTATISFVKKLLSTLGYNDKDLSIAFGGCSKGGNIALLYSYLNKEKTHIPVKFIINLLESVTLEFQYYYKLKD